MKRYGLHAALSASIIVLDQLTKALIVKTVSFYGSIAVIPGFLELTHIHNKGAILGIFNRTEQPWTPVLLLLLNAVALGLVIFYFSKTTEKERVARLALAMIVGGALGNVVDRITRGYVVDFVEMHVGKFHWPTYNVADASITIGAVLLISSVIFRRPHASDSV
ncbi:MAG: signal peptidase II [Candidatus Aminicenantes bacterium]|nr:signal peptidase II [Candidatus Aminicenantes bacterium]